MRMKRMVVIWGLCLCLLVAWIPEAASMSFVEITDLFSWETDIRYGSPTIAPEGGQVLMESGGLEGACYGFLSTNLTAEKDASSPGDWSEFFPRGLVATVNVTSVSGDARVGIRVLAGKHNAADLYFEVWLDSWDGTSTVRYGAFEESADGTKNQLSVGVFGEWSSGWNPGETLQLAVVWFGEEAWAYVSAHQFLPQFMPLFEVLAGEPKVQAFIWTNSGVENQVSATISNVWGIVP